MSGGSCYGLSGSRRGLCKIDGKGQANAHKMPLHIISCVGPTNTGPFSNPLVIYRHGVHGQDDTLEALAATFFDENGQAVALPAKAVFITLLLLADKSTFNKFRKEVYSAPFIKSIVLQFASKYGLPLVAPAKWEPITVGAKLKRAKRQKTPSCQFCGPATDKAVYEVLTGMKLCKDCWRKCGATRQSGYISLETIQKTSSCDELDRVPKNGKSRRETLINMYKDDFIDLAWNLVSDRAHDEKYNYINGRAETICWWLLPEGGPVMLTPRAWMILYRWNPARASSLAKVKCNWMKLRSSFSVYLERNLPLQALCATLKPDHIYFPIVYDPLDDEATRKATFETLFFATETHILKATAVWFFNMLFVTKQIKIEIVFEGPPLKTGDPGLDYNLTEVEPGTEYIDPFTLRRWVSSKDATATIVNGHGITYPLLYFVAVNSLRRFRFEPTQVMTFRIHVSWSEARQNTHIGKMVVGPAASQMIHYALASAAKGEMPTVMTLSWGKTFNPAMYETKRAKGLQSENEIITKCMTAAPDASKMLEEIIDSPEENDFTFQDFVKYVQRHSEKTTPPNELDIFPPLATGSRPDQEPVHRSKESSGERVKKRRTSIFGSA